MTHFKTPKEWECYCADELAQVRPHLQSIGITLDALQPHLRGERYLMSGKKLVLLGARSGMRVVVKASRHQEGRVEIEREHAAREILLRLPFAYRMFRIPNELWYGRLGEYRIAVLGYLEQERPFLSRALAEQFALALQAFKTQESVHASTYAHARTIRAQFGFWSAQTYVRWFTKFYGEIRTHVPNDPALHEALMRAQKALKEGTEDIERYCGFLTHEDFALMNLRISGDDVYLIDLSSLRFGNKHESWARFLNFMLLYNRPLEQALLAYIRDNRSEEEQRSLYLMRIYKTAELLAFYTQAWRNSSGSLRVLSRARIEFWTAVLNAFATHAEVPDSLIETYKQARDSLRSPEERERQKELQQL